MEGIKSLRPDAQPLGNKRPRYCLTGSDFYRDCIPTLPGSSGCFPCPETPQSSRQLQECQTGKNRPELSDKQLDLGYAAEDAAASLTAAPQRSAITNRLHFCLQIVRLGICAVPKANVAIKGPSNGPDECASLRTHALSIRKARLARTHPTGRPPRTICGKK